ncbi:MAG: hypothetical protein AB7Q29_16140 [Vicinamibacterales bacterium]
MISRAAFLACLPGLALLRRLPPAPQKHAEHLFMYDELPPLVNPACEITGSRVHMVWDEPFYGRSFVEANDLDTKQRVKNNLLRKLLDEYERGLLG